jgi:hypothetical protein
MLTFHFEPLVCVGRHTNTCSRLRRDDRTVGILSHSLRASKWEWKGRSSFCPLKFSGHTPEPTSDCTLSRSWKSSRPAVGFFGADGMVFGTQRITDAVEQFPGFGLSGRHGSFLAVAGPSVLVYTGGGEQI